MLYYFTPSGLFYSLKGFNKQAQGKALRAKNVISKALKGRNINFRLQS